MRYRVDGNGCREIGEWSNPHAAAVAFGTKLVSDGLANSPVQVFVWCYVANTTWTYMVRVKPRTGFDASAELVDKQVE